MSMTMDVLALSGRHTRHLVRLPEKLIGVVLGPIIVVLLFGFLFGNVVVVPSGPYQEFVVAGGLAQVMLSLVGGTAAGISDDLRNGLVDRFRSLPVHNVSVLLARTISDLLLALVSCLIMAVVGLFIGWRVHTGPLEVVTGFALLSFLGFTMAWTGALIGLKMRSAEAVNSLTALLMVPPALLSSALVPAESLPGPLRDIAMWNPVSGIVNATRELFGNQPPPSADAAFPLRHPWEVAVAALLVLLVVVAPLAVKAFQRAEPR
ncbi:ABC transporter permease [Lentzea sp. NPDC055074]